MFHKIKQFIFSSQFIPAEISDKISAQYFSTCLKFAFSIVFY